MERPLDRVSGMSVACDTQGHGVQQCQHRSLALHTHVQIVEVVMRMEIEVVV